MKPINEKFKQAWQLAVVVVFFSNALWADVGKSSMHNLFARIEKADLPAVELLLRSLPHDDIQTTQFKYQDPGFKKWGRKSGRGVLIEMWQSGFPTFLGYNDISKNVRLGSKSPSPEEVSVKLRPLGYALTVLFGKYSSPKAFAEMQSEFSVVNRILQETDKVEPGELQFLLNLCNLFSLGLEKDKAESSAEYTKWRTKSDQCYSLSRAMLTKPLQKGGQPNSNEGSEKGDMFTVNKY